MLWLGDLSDTDAGLYLEKMKFSSKVKAELPTEKKDYYEENPLEFVKYVEQRKREIFEQVGTHPSILNELMTSELTTQKFIEKELAAATNKLTRSTRTNPLWAAAYKKLLSKKPPDDFLTWDEICDATKLTPKDILAAVKEFHALTFDVEKEVFSFYSPAVRTAAKGVISQRTWASSGMTATPKTVFLRLEHGLKWGTQSQTVRYGFSSLVFFAVRQCNLTHAY